MVIVDRQVVNYLAGIWRQIRGGREFGAPEAVAADDVLPGADAGDFVVGQGGDGQAFAAPADAVLGKLEVGVVEPVWPALGGQAGGVGGVDVQVETRFGIGGGAGFLEVDQLVAVAVDVKGAAGGRRPVIAGGDGVIGHLVRAGGGKSSCCTRQTGRPLIMYCSAFQICSPPTMYWPVRMRAIW